MFLSVNRLLEKLGNQDFGGFESELLGFKSFLLPLFKDDVKDKKGTITEKGTKTIIKDLDDIDEFKINDSEKGTEKATVKSIKKGLALFEILCQLMHANDVYKLERSGRWSDAQGGIISND